MVRLRVGRALNFCWSAMCLRNMHLTFHQCLWLLAAGSWRRVCHHPRLHVFVFDSAVYEIQCDASPPTHSLLVFIQGAGFKTFQLGNTTLSFVHVHVVAEISLHIFEDAVGIRGADGPDADTGVAG